MFMRNAVLCFAMSICSAKAAAVELGTTPSHLFGLWTNINSALIGVAEAYSTDVEWVEQLRQTKHSRFAGKGPVDVLDGVAMLRAKLDRLLRSAELAPQRKAERSAKEALTPSAVFLSSGHVLDSTVRLIVHGRESHSEGTSGRLIGRYFLYRSFPGRTPNDVYALVDLANRRAEQLLAKVGA